VLGKTAVEMAILLPTLLLLAVLGAGLFAIAKARRWHHEIDGDDEEDSSPVATLERYRQMVEEGELDPEELEAIEARIKGAEKPAPPPPPQPVDDPPPRP
jgi:hypothetical protein